MLAVSDFSIAESTLEALCKRFGVKELALFGSRARGDHNANSDLDILVEFLPDAHVGLLELSGMQIELEELFERKVDLVPKRALKPLIRDSVLSQAKPFYHAS